MTFKVANVICRFNSGSGGPPRSVARIAQAGLGHWRAELFSTDYVGPADDALLVADFPGYASLLSHGSQTAWGGLKMAAGTHRDFNAQLARSVHSDVIHLHGLWSPYLAAFAWTAMRNGIPYIVSPRGMLEPWSLSVHTWRKSLALKTYQGRILAGASAIHATSTLEADNVRRLGRTYAAIVVVPNAVDEPPQVAVGGRQAADGRKVLLFLSRVHEKKGLDILLRAWNAIRPGTWELLIVGSGVPSYVDRLKRMCAEEHIPNVEFHPHVDGDRREMMFSRAAAFVLPTYSENFGNAVAEALVRGLPVITTTATPWSIVSEQKLGWYIEPELQSLKRALLELLATETQELQAMGARGRAYATANLSSAAVVPRLLDMYRLAMRR